MPMKIRFSDIPHIVKGNFTENNYIETDSTDGNIPCKLSINLQGDRPFIDGCRIFLPANTRGEVIIHFGYDGSQVIFGENTSCKLDLRLWRTSSIYVGKNTTSNGCIIITDNSDVFIGEDCMFSDGILIQSNDQHGLIDLDTQKLINADRRTVMIGDHVWIGRRAIVMPDVRIGQGSVIGSGAIVVKDAEPFTYNVGVPAKKVRERSSWTRDPEFAAPEEIAFFKANGFPWGP